MKFQTTIILLIVISATQYEICANIARNKRSFPWSSFLSGNSNVIPVASAKFLEANNTYDEVDHHQIQQKQSDKQQIFLQQLQQQDIQHIQKLQQQAYAPHQQIVYNPNIPYYHYPTWRVPKYNGIDLKPIPVSLMPARLQPLRVSSNSQVHHSDTMNSVQTSEVFAKKTEYQLPVTSDSIDRTIPDELRNLAFSLGIDDLSKLPSLDEAMNLLGATTPEETISIIKELAATENGKELIKQFMQSSDDDTDAVGKVNVEQEQQHLKQKQQQLEQQFTQPNHFHVTEKQQHQARQQYRKQPQLIQRQPDNHQYFDPSDVVPHRHYGPGYSSIYGSPQFRHPNQLLQPPTLTSNFRAGLKHTNTDHSHSHNVVKEAKPSESFTDHSHSHNVVKEAKPSESFFQSITHIFLPPHAEVDPKVVQKSADAPMVVPAQTISHNSIALSDQHPLNPILRVQQQQHIQPHKQSEFQIPLTSKEQHVRTYPSIVLNPVTEIHSIAQPLDETKSVTFQDENDNQPDISRMPLDNHKAFMNISQGMTLYGTPALPNTFDDDLDGVASKQIITVVRAPISNKLETQENYMEKRKNEIGFQPSEEDFSIQRGISNRPQRISSYDSYATGKISRADAEAVRIAIPTQTPPTIAPI